MGRPTALTAEVAAEILRIVRAGNFRATAMRACGLSKNVIRNWEKRGEEGEEPYASFVEELQIAEANSEVDLVALVRSADSISGAAHHIQMLERRFGDRWCARINQHKRETEDAILAKLRANPKLHAEVAHVLASEEDQAAGAAPSH